MESKLNQDIHPLDNSDDHDLLAFDKFIQAVVKGQPNSETVASLTELRSHLETTFIEEFQPEVDQISYLRSKQRHEAARSLLQEWCQFREKNNMSCKQSPLTDGLKSNISTIE